MSSFPVSVSPALLFSQSCFTVTVRYRKPQRIIEMNDFSCSLTTYFIVIERSECPWVDNQAAVSLQQKCYKKHKDLRHPSLWRPTCLMKCELSGQLPGELECATMCVFLLDFWPGSAYGSSETPLRVWSVSVLPCCFDSLFVWTMWSDWRKFHCASSRHSHSHTIHTEPTYKLAGMLALTQHSIIYQELQCRP